MNTAFHRSKIDSWLLMAFALSSVAAVAACWPVVRHGTRSDFVVAGATLMAGIGLPWWILSTTTYAIGDEDLVVRSGPFRWAIPLRSIRSIERTRNPLSSPALSLDRLRIEYGSGKWIMVSPADRVRFLDDLEKRGVRLAPR